MVNISLDGLNVKKTSVNICKDWLILAKMLVGAYRYLDRIILTNYWLILTNYQLRMTNTGYVEYEICHWICRYSAMARELSTQLPVSTSFNLTT